MKVPVQVFLHFVNGFIPFLPALDSKVLIQKGSMKPFDETIALGATDLCPPVFDTFQLEKKFIRMAILPATEFSAIIA